MYKKQSYYIQRKSFFFNKTLKSFFKIFLCGLLTLIIVLFSNNIYAQESENTVQKIEGTPVFLGRLELFTIQAKVGSFSPEDRAEVIEKRIKLMADDLNTDVNNLAIENTDNLTNIILDKKVIITITDGDAKAVRSSKEELAESYIKIIQDKVTQYRTERTPDYLIRSGIYTLLLTLAMILFLLIISKLVPKIYGLIERNKGQKIKGIKFQNAEIISPNQLGDIFIKITKIIHWIIILIIIYVYLPFALSFFPWTKQLSDIIFNQINNTFSAILSEFFDYLPNLVTITVIVLISYYFIRFCQSIFTKLEIGNITFPGFYPEWAQPTYKLLTFIIVSLVIVIIFPYLPGFNSPAFQGVSIFIGILVSLGSTAVVSNIVAGIILIYTRGFEIDDRVKISDTVGDIVEKTLFVTRIRTPKNVIITIPNAMVLDSHIINYSASVVDKNIPLVLHTTITLGYDVPWRKVHEVLKEAAMMTENILDEPSPFVLQTSLDDFYVSYELNAYTYKSRLMSNIYSELHQHLQDKCNEADIEILSPHYSALRDGNQTTIPEQYLPSDYQAPSFRVNPLNKLFNKK